jgi:hypothetical protein
MNYEQFAKAVAASRAPVEVVIDGRAFLLRVPTEHEAKLTVARCRDRLAAHGSFGPLEAMTESERALLSVAVVGWRDVKVADVLPDAEDAELAFSSGAVPLVLDAKPEWESQLNTALGEAMRARQEKQEAAEKN